MPVTVSEVQKLIDTGESLTVEFKRELSNKRPQNICKEIAALATMQGGHLLIGVDDYGSVLGVSDPEGIIAKIENWVGDQVAPTPQISLKVVSFELAQLVYIHIAEGVAPLYYYDGRPYLRVGTISTVARPEQVEHLIATGRLVSEMRAAVAQMVSLEIKLNPSQHTAAGIFGQGELATMNYEQLRGRLFEDLCRRLQSGAKSNQS